MRILVLRGEGEHLAKNGGKINCSKRCDTCEDKHCELL